MAAALVALVAYNAMQVGIFGLYGFAASSALEQFLGLHVPWWICALVTVAIIAVLGQLQVDLNAKVLAFFLIAESLVVLVFDIAGIAKPAEGLTVEPFLPATLARRVGRRPLLRHGVVRGLRICRDLWRGVQGPAEDRRPRHVHRGHHHRRLLRRLGLGDRDGRRPEPDHRHVPGAHRGSVVRLFGAASASGLPT